MLALFGVRFGDYCDHYGYVRLGYGGDPPVCDNCCKTLDDSDIERLKEEMREHIRAASEPSECSKDALRQASDEDADRDGTTPLLRASDAQSEVRGTQ